MTFFKHFKQMSITFAIHMNFEVYSVTEDEDIVLLYEKHDVLLQTKNLESLLDDS